MIDESGEPDPAGTELLLAELERESARVGVNWDQAAEWMRAMAAQEWVPSDDGESGEVILGLDATGLLATLRGLPDNAGTTAFLDAFERDQEGS